MRVKILIAGFIALFSLAACSNPDERYDTGYRDGYAVGYNGVCHLAAPVIEGDFVNSNYQTGYQAGYDAGIRACHEQR